MGTQDPTSPKRDTYTPPILAQALDYIFTEEDELIEDVDYLPPLAKRYHACLAFHYVLGEAVRNEPVEKLN